MHSKNKYKQQQQQKVINTMLVDDNTMPVGSRSCNYFLPIFNILHNIIKL